jgi:hypothetical protein
MKSKLSFLLASMALAIIASSCSRTEETGSEPIALDALVVKTIDAGPGIIAFKGADIQSFNESTGEITFKGLSTQNILEWLTTDRTLAFFVNDVLLFSVPAVNPTDSRSYNDLVFYYDQKRLYLKDGYPFIDTISMSSSQIEQILKARNEAAIKRQPAWNIFMTYLRDNDLLTFDTTPDPDQPSVPNIPDTVDVFPPISEYDLAATITHTVPTYPGKDSSYTGMAFTIKDIQSFNPTTGEIAFLDAVPAYLQDLNLYTLNVFNRSTPVFDATIMTSDATQTVNDLVFLVELYKEGALFYPQKYRYFLLDGYPDINSVADKEQAQALRQANSEKRKAGWNTFIQILSNHSKIISDRK